MYITQDAKRALRPMRALIRANAAVALAAPLALGLVVPQAPAPNPAPTFAAVSVKPSNDPTGHQHVDADRGRLNMVNVSLKRCIMVAFNVGPNQVIGGPGWLDNDHFTIQATADKPMDEAAVMANLQALLANRFKLRVQSEKRDLPAYRLEVAKNGPKFKKSNADHSETTGGSGTLTASGTSMEELAKLLERQMDLPVVNETGLDGSFDFSLTWTPERRDGSAADASTPLDTGPTLFTALQEQLGLRLSAGKAPIPVVVVVRAEHPTAD